MSASGAPDRDQPTLRVQPVAPAALARPSGRYEVSEALGAGGMGQVHRATDPALGRRVAIKRPRTTNPAQLARFVREAQLTSQLAHPNIVPVYELATDADGLPYYTMKEIEGRTLGEVARSGDLTLAGLLGVFVKVCDALAFAHSRGVIHRDLKPDNVMVGAFGEVLVLDWGLATMTNDERRMTNRGPGSADPLQTQAGAVLGTPAYMAPEQARGEIGRIDSLTDIYALGAMLYHMLAGRPPFEGSGLDEVLEQVREGRLVPPSRRVSDRRIPWELEAVVLRAMAHRRRNRYQSVEALKQDIEAFLDGRRLAAARYGLRAAAWNWLKRHRYLAAAVLLVAATAGAFGGWRAAEHARERAAARRAVERMDPDKLIAAADASLAKIPAEPKLRRAVSPEERERLLAQIQHLRRLGTAYAAWQQIDPGHPEVRRRLFALWLLVSRLAEVIEDYGFAALAADNAAALRLDPARVERRHAGIAAARQVLLDRRKERILAVLQEFEDASRPIEEQSYHFRSALIRLVRVHQPQTIELLAARLDRYTGLLEQAVRSRLLAEKAPQPDATTARYKPLVGLEQAVTAWLAWLAPPGPGRPAAPAPSAAQRALIQQALRRLETRARPLTRQSWRDQLAAACTEALRRAGPGADASVRLLTAALGRIPDPGPGRRALVRYLGAEWDGPRAVNAGQSLARLTRHDPALEWTLEHLAGLAPRQQQPARWGFNALWWQQTAGELRRLQQERTARSAPRAGESPASAREHNRRGTVRLGRGDLDGAIAEYTRAIALDPAAAHVWNNRGGARQTKGDIDGAIADYTRAIALDPKYATAWGNRGNGRKAKGDIDGAIADYTRAIAIDPKYAAAWGYRGLARKAKGDLDGAIADCSRAIALDPKHGPNWNNRGVARGEKGDLEGAIEDCTRAIALDPKNARAWSNRGHVRKLKGEIDSAIEDCTRAIAIDPRFANAWSNRGNAREAKGDIDGAIEDYTRAIALDPKLARVWSNRGVAREQKGDLKGAFQDHTRAIALAPKVAAFWNNRGATRKAKGDLDGAIEDCTRAIALDPKFAQAWTNRGTARQKSGDIDGAIEDHTRAIALDPRFADAWNNRGVARKSKGNPDGAIADYTRAIELDPKYYNAWNNRGIARQKKGDLAGAIADHTRAIELDPKYYNAWNNRGIARQKKGDLAGAIADHTRAIALDTKRADAWNARGAAHGARGDVDAAIADFTRTTSLSPRLWEAWANLGVAQSRKGNRAAAIRALERALALAPLSARAKIAAWLKRVRQSK